MSLTASGMTNPIPLGGGGATMQPLAGYPKGSGTVSVKATIKPAAPVQTVNLQSLAGGAALGKIVTVYVDNSGGPIPVTLTMADTTQVIAVPAFTQGYYPALTNGLVFNVSAPLVGVFGNPVTVPIQCLNFEVRPQSAGPLLPVANGGTAQAIGTPPWATWTGAVPSDPVNGPLLYTALELDMTPMAGNLSVSGTAVDGSIWTASQLPLQKSEIIIPATASGSTASAAIITPYGTTVASSVNARWRVQPSGEQPSHSVPLYMPWTPYSYTSMATGNTTVNFLAPSASYGVYIDKISLAASGWSVGWNFLLLDESNAAQNFLEVAFPSGSVIWQEDIGYTSYRRGNGGISFQIQNSGAAAGVLTVNIRGSLIAASQQG